MTPKIIFTFIIAFALTITADSASSDDGLISLGPVTGGVTDNEAVFVLKTSAPSNVKIELSPDPSFVNSSFTQEVSTDEAGFNYAKIKSVSLDPDTRYFYRAIVNGTASGRVHSFRTFPTERNRNFSFGFGSCQQGRAKSNPEIFPVIAEDSLSFFIHLGDWTYPDYRIGRGFNSDMSKLEESYAMKYDYSYPFSSLVLSEMPIAYVYDDHEYAGNDEDGTNPYKLNSVKAYSMFFPHYELGNPDNGIWQKFRYADAEFFLLDLRTQRNNVDSVFDETGKFNPPAGHSMLKGFEIDGVDQKTWLEKSLKESNAKWKVIVSSVIFNPGYSKALNDDRVSAAFPRIKEGIVDKWAGFPEDIDFLLNIIKENDIKNVIIISGDSHSSYIDDGTNSIIPEISSSNLDTRNSRIGLLASLAGFNIWNQGSFNDDGGSYGRISFSFDGEEYALLELVDKSGKAIASYKVNLKF